MSMKNGAQLYQGLTKPEAAILVPLRAGKNGLGGYLKRIKVVAAAVCQCQRSNNMVLYILGDCFQFRAQRRTYLGQPTVWNVPALLSRASIHTPYAIQACMEYGIWLKPHMCYGPGPDP